MPSGGLGVTKGKDRVQLRAVAVTSWLLILPFTRVDSAKPCNGWTVLPLNQCLPHGQGLITGLLGICTVVVPTKSKKTLLGRVSSGLCSVLNAPLCGASLASASQQDLLSCDGQHKPLPRAVQQGKPRPYWQEGQLPRPGCALGSRHRNSSLVRCAHLTAVSATVSTSKCSTRS